MARLFILLRLTLFIVQVRNGMHGSPLLAKAEQENERQSQEQTTQHGRILTQLPASHQNATVFPA
jgi:hypothetical protein